MNHNCIGPVNFQILIAYFFGHTIFRKVRGEKLYKPSIYIYIYIYISHSIRWIHNLYIYILIDEVERKSNWNSIKV